MGKKKRAYSREERMIQVKTQFAIWIQNGQKEWRTTYELCEALDLARSSKFQAILNEMVGDGVLVRRQIERPGRWTGYEYTLTPGTFQRPRRTISLRLGGKQVDQLELFS